MVNKAELQNHRSKSILTDERPLKAKSQSATPNTAMEIFQGNNCNLLKSSFLKLKSVDFFKFETKAIYKMNSYWEYLFMSQRKLFFFPIRI